MRQLLKNQFKSIYLIIVCFLTLIIFFFPSCASKNNQDVQSTDKTVAATQAPEDNIRSSDQKQMTASSVESIKLLQKTDSVEVLIEGNKELKYTSIKQSFPFGIAIYLPNTFLGDKLKPITPKDGIVSNIIPSYADKDKKTAKIEILLNHDLTYDIKKQGNILQVKLPYKNSIAKTTNTQSKIKKEDRQKTSSKKLQIPKSIATLSDIEFNVQDNGNTELTVTTSHPINYDFSKGTKGILYLNLYKTKIPVQHKRPFETLYFKSAVHRILPIQKTKNAKIEISMREKVPYQVVQDNNIITVRFEPSSIEPPKFTKADKTLPAMQPKVHLTNSQENQFTTKSPDMIYADKKEVTNNQPTVSADMALKSNYTEIANQPSSIAETQPIERKIFSPTKEKVYTGEKIKLDFYETDIKNVFRILSSISKSNFAIDKDVTGSVTLTLDNPIPWDQVLDLVLSMNQLEKVEKGNVIRIATQTTLAEEAKQQHSKFEAMRKVAEERKALEPLITEYIPINYANAATDILPHITNILTKDRGTASVDARTNMVIITDTNPIVEKAKHLIYTLDNVTPQIMISAKIIEANKEFSRDFGLGLSFGFDDNGTNVNDNYDVSMNAPATSATPSNTASFTFNNLVSDSLLGTGNAFLTATINASESKGDVSVLSSPKIMTLDNKKAIIKQGLEYPYAVIDNEGNVTVEFKDIDLLLEVTPHVTPDKRISMEIFVTKNEISGEFVAGVPPVSTNEATTTLLVDNNDTIVIGGVLKSYKSEGESGFPFLMNIPLLGRLFRTDTDINEKKELLIFLTPTIVQLKQKKNVLTSDQVME